MAEIHRIHGERTVFEAALARCAGQIFQSPTTRFVFVELIHATPTNTGVVEWTVEAATKATGYGVGATQRALREIVASGMVVRSSEGRRIGCTFTWQPSRVAELAAQVPSDKVCCFDDNFADIQAVWLREYAEAWARRYSPNVRPRLEALPSRPGPEGWNRLSTWALGRAEDLTVDVERVVQRGARVFLRLTARDDARIEDEKHPLSFLPRLLGIVDPRVVAELRPREERPREERAPRVSMAKPSDVASAAEIAKLTSGFLARAAVGGAS